MCLQAGHSQLVFENSQSCSDDFYFEKYMCIISPQRHMAAEPQLRIKNDRQNTNNDTWRNSLQFSDFHLFVFLAKF